MAIHDEESLFNMGLAYLKRIDSLLYHCQKAAMLNELENWVANLRGVYREVSVRISKDEEERILGKAEDRIDIEKLIDSKIEHDEATFKHVYFLLNHPKYKITHRTTIMFLLDTLEVKLRRLLQSKGMLLPSKDDPRKAILKF